MYLNNFALNILNENVILYENIFSIKNWTKEHKNEIKQAIETIKRGYEKEIQEGVEAFKKNYKRDYEFIKKNNIPFLLIADTFQKFKKIFEKFQQFDNRFKKTNINMLYKYVASHGPATLVIDLQVSEKEEQYKIPFIFIPEKTFFEKVLLKGEMLGFFTHPLWIELEKMISIYHEAVEFNSYAHKEFHLGAFYVKHGGDFYRYGNHFSIFVLVKEAIILNKFKHLKAIKVLRDFRKKYEWRIIKAKTGVDLSTITKITPELMKKIKKINPEKFGDVEGLFLDSRELPYYGTVNIKNKKMLGEIKNDFSKFKIPENIKIIY